MVLFTTGFIDNEEAYIDEKLMLKFRNYCRSTYGVLTLEERPAGSAAGGPCSCRSVSNS